MLNNPSNIRKRAFKKFTPLKSFAFSAPTNNINMIPAQHFVRHTGHKRPVDKLLIVLKKQSVDATQVSTILTTVTFPCTIVGLRWDISASTSAGTGPGEIEWAIVKVTDGDSANTLSFTDGATLYAPEQAVMTWGVGNMPPFDKSANPINWRGDTKTMRKMMGGDQLIFIVRGEATNVADIRGAVQFFCKT